jgi:hypothetical protein
MYRRLTVSFLALLLAAASVAAREPITPDQVRQVIDATDAAAQARDAAAIGVYLSDGFERVIEFPIENWMAKVRLDRDKYLQMLDTGWAGLESYDYTRSDTSVHMLPDGVEGLSFSTITEHLTVDGMPLTSRFRESAYYALEHGRPVITRIEGHTLIGDTTPH